ncbi:MAG TPA: hypothetical protein ENJ32_00845 [Crenotrichaceae bacterium]|nr:hypothetical protein [Crenotrichaceae bacterium]
MFVAVTRVGEFGMQLIKPVVLVVFVLAVGGCSNNIFDTRTDQQRAEDRATQRWQLLMKRDFSAAYQYLSPGSRETVPKNVYLGRFGKATQWLDASPVSSECQDGICEITVAVKYKIQHKYSPKGIENTRNIKEKWIHDDGQWWYLLEK